MSDTLLLNATAQPVSYLPLSVITWQEAIRYMFSEKASVIEWYDDWIVHSTSWATPVPSVIMLNEFAKPKSTVRFSKHNVFLRDEWKCQYCGVELTTNKATIDHVLPLSKGGKTTFTNIVTACTVCNFKKGNDHRIKPPRPPYKPEYWELVTKRKKFPFYIKNENWKVYMDLR